ncbi:TPA: hypothetical protein VAK69_006578, partial [Pseudomonas aeruginosa]|nr:hypothetical protein [Pseudomonas aeruginosa]
WQEFQSLSIAVATAYFGLNFKAYGRNGQWQGGIDAYAYTSDGRIIAVQSKSKDAGYGSVLTPSDVTKAAAKAHEFKFKIDVLIIMTSSRDDRKLSDRALEITQAQQAKGEFSVEVWGWQTIEEIIGKHESIRRRHFAYTLPKTSTWQWIARASFLGALIGLFGYFANEYLDYRAQTKQRQGETGLSVKGFIEQSDRLSAAYSNCQGEMGKNIFLSSFEFKRYCSEPVDKQLQAMHAQLQELALDIDSDVFERMKEMLKILDHYHYQGRGASLLTASYEDIYRKNMLNLCGKKTDELFSDELRRLLKDSAVQQLEYYHALSNFIYPSLAAMKAQVVASAQVTRGQKVAPSVLVEANELNRLFLENQAYHLEEVKYPFTLSAVKVWSSPKLGITDESGLTEAIEAQREKDVLLGGAISIYYGHHQEARQLIECGAMKPELIPLLEKREAEITDLASASPKS